MDEAIRAILEGKHVAALATLMKDGAPKTAAVWYGFEGDDIVVSTISDRPKARNVERDARVSLLIDLREAPYKGVEVRGTATIEPDPGGERTKAIARRYLDEVPAEMSQRLSTEARSIIRIRPTRFRTWDYSQRR